MSTIKRVSGDYLIKSLNPGDSVMIQDGSTTIDGNLTVTGNAVLVGNINADKIFSGTSNVEIPLPNGNVTVGVGGVGNLAVFSTTGVSVTGNITGNYILGNGSQLTGVAASSANFPISSGNTTTTSFVVTGDTSGNLVMSATSQIVDFSSNTGSFGVPSGTTAQRPSSPVNGMIRYNTTLNVLEFYSNGAWSSIT